MKIVLSAITIAQLIDHESTTASLPMMEQDADRLEVHTPGKRELVGKFDVA